MTTATRSERRPPRRPGATRPTAVANRALDWSDLQTFAAVCQAGSVSAAAARLGVNHSTVVRRVGALEATLGAALFDRTAAGYRLTQPGRELLDGLGSAEARIAEAPRQVHGRDDEVRGEIRLTTTDTLAHGLLMPPLREFCDRHDGVRLRIVINNNFLSLTRREADVAIRGSNRPPENLVGRHLGDIRTAPYAARRYLASLGRRRPLAELDWITPDASLAHLAQAQWLRAQVSAERIVMSVDSLVGMVHAVRCGIGAAMLLCPLADVHAAELVQLEPPAPALDTQLWILTHPDLRQVARVRAFSQFMFEALSRDPRLAPRAATRR